MPGIAWGRVVGVLLGIVAAVVLIVALSKPHSLIDTNAAPAPPAGAPGAPPPVERAEVPGAAPPPGAPAAPTMGPRIPPRPAQPRTAAPPATTTAGRVPAAGCSVDP
jgi:hypothetical protein